MIRLHTSRIDEHITNDISLGLSLLGGTGPRLQKQSHSQIAANEVISIREPSHNISLGGSGLVST